MPFEVPESWVWTTIGEIASSILYGVSESAKETGQYKLLRITDIQNNKVNWKTVPFTDYDNNKAQAYLLNDGDILFARTGATVGKSYLVEDLKASAIYASYLIRVQTSSAILPAYIKFFFDSGFYWEQISLSSVGIGQPNVNGTTLAALTIPIPPYLEQLRIVEEAKKLLSVIDGLDVEIDDLQTYITQAKSKILDLAIHGKLVPQDPNDEPAFELLKRINPKFEPCDNEHYPFDIPKTWAWCKLIDLCSFLSRGKSPTYSEERKYPVFAQKCNLYGGGISLEQARFLDPNTLSKWSEDYKLRDGDVLVNSTGTGTVGRTRLFQKDCLGNYPFVVPDSHVSVVRTVDDIDSDYVFSMMSSKYGQEYIEDNLAGSTNQKELYIGVLENMLIPIPPKPEQLRISAKVKELLSVLDEIKNP